MTMKTAEAACVGGAIGLATGIIRNALHHVNTVGPRACGMTTTATMRCCPGGAVKESCRYQESRPSTHRVSIHVVLILRTT